MAEPARGEKQPPSTEAEPDHAPRDPATRIELALKGIARVLKLYATALSGRDVAIRATNETHVIDAYSAEHIVLPPEMRFFDDDAHNFTAYKVAAAHGAGRIEFGTYEFSLADIPETVAELRARYPRVTP